MCTGRQAGSTGCESCYRVVLLLAVTVMLGLVVGPGVIGNIGSLANETPNGESAFFFEEREEGGGQTTSERCCQWVTG